MDKLAVKFLPQRCLVVVAMKSELDAVLALPYEWRRTELAGGFVLHEAGNCLVVTKAGIGPVRGAMATQAALMHCGTHSIDAIVSLGVGGALRPSLEPGDLVLATRVIKHDTRCGASLMVPGSAWVSLPEKQRELIDPAFVSNNAVMTWICEVLNGQPFSTGALLSGDEFVNTTKRKTELAAIARDASMVDMEAGGIVQVAKCYDVPFIALRTTADTFKPNDDDVAVSYLYALERATESAAAVVGRIFQYIQESREFK